jgi:transposase
MSFIRKIKRDGKIYLAEVENIRVDGKVKQRHIRYVGKEEDGKTILSCSISDAEISSVKLSGPLMALNSISNSIGLPDILGEYSNEILSMVFAHCLDYQSLNHMKKWYERTDLNLILNLENLTEKRLVNALDSLNSKIFIEKQNQIFKNVQKHLGITTNGIVYDVTNTYFYGKKSRLAKYGHDKEKRKGYPLIQIGLAVTQDEGIPIFHKTFPGNIHDSRTFSDISNDLEIIGIKKGIAVMDRGITSGENSTFMNGKQWKLLCGMKIDNGIKKKLGVNFSSHNLCIEKNRFRMNKTIFYCTEIPYTHGSVKGRLILIFNRKKALLTEESRLDEVHEAKLRLAKNLTIKPDIEKFFNKKGMLLNEELNNAKKFDGMSFLFTTSDLKIEDAIKAYFDKDVVEKCFQSLKGVIRLRPVRHWLYNRVEAHVFICYLSSLILSILKTKVSALKLSFQEAIHELDGLYRVYIKDPKNNFQIDRLVALTKIQEKILRTIDKNLLKQCSVQN